jgi:hypothetical protein
MRIVNPRVLVAALALFALACAPRRPCMPPDGGPCGGRGPGMAMARSCGADSCTYGSRCFSSGAIRSNDGACQACSAGKWVDATGCGEPCGKRGGKSPCDHEHHRHHHR